MIGRAAAEADIPLPRAGLSKRHAVIEIVFEEPDEDSGAGPRVAAWLEDLQSTNGTRLQLGPEPEFAATTLLRPRRMYQLTDNSIIRFGATACRFQLLTEKDASELQATQVIPESERQESQEMGLDGFEASPTVQPVLPQTSPPGRVPAALLLPTLDGGGLSDDETGDEAGEGLEEVLEPTQVPFSVVSQSVMPAPAEKVAEGSEGRDVKKTARDDSDAMDTEEQSDGEGMEDEAASQGAEEEDGGSPPAGRVSSSEDPGSTFSPPLPSLNVTVDHPVGSENDEDGDEDEGARVDLKDFRSLVEDEKVQQPRPEAGGSEGWISAKPSKTLSGETGTAETEKSTAEEAGMEEIVEVEVAVVDDLVVDTPQQPSTRKTRKSSSPSTVSSVWERPLKEEPKKDSDSVGWISSRGSTSKLEEEDREGEGAEEEGRGGRGAEEVPVGGEKETSPKPRQQKPDSEVETEASDEQEGTAVQGTGEKEEKKEQMESGPGDDLEEAEGVEEDEEEETEPKMDEAENEEQPDEREEEAAEDSVPSRRKSRRTSSRSRRVAGRGANADEEEKEEEVEEDEEKEDAPRSRRSSRRRSASRSSRREESKGRDDGTNDSRMEIEESEASEQGNEAAEGGEEAEGESEPSEADGRKRRRSARASARPPAKRRRVSRSSGHQDRIVIMATGIQPDSAQQKVRLRSLFSWCSGGLDLLIYIYSRW